MIYRDKWLINLSTHAQEGAWSSGVTEDMIKATIINGKMKWFAKNNVDFISEYKRGKVICRGQIKNDNFILIFTIMRG